MTTAVSICSNALLRLGANAISSFDEADQDGSNIELARLAVNLWPTVRRKTLRAGTWNCAIARALLSPDTTAPPFGYANRFQMPSDWLRTIAVGEDERARYRKEGNYLMSDEATLPLVYVFDNVNPETYDAALVESLELAMMAALAYPVTKSTSLASEIAALAESALRMARGLDGQDDPAETLGDFPMMASRRGRRAIR